MVLALGILGPALFLAADFHGAAITEGYSQIRDPVPVLTQRGAVQATALNVMHIAAAALQLAFGAAVSAAFAGRDLRLVLAGRYIMAYAAMGAAIAAFFAMDPMGSAATWPGRLHLALVTLLALALILAILMARRTTLPAWFGGFSSVALAVMFAGAGLAGIAGMAGLPILGLAERMTQWTYLLWLVVLAVLCIADDMRRG